MDYRSYLARPALSLQQKPALADVQGHFLLQGRGELFIPQSLAFEDCFGLVEGWGSLRERVRLPRPKVALGRLF